jgi:hypothetical protein
VVYPLANLLATEQIRFGDMILVDWDEQAQRITFEREGQGAVIPAPTRRRARPAPLRSAAAAAREEKVKFPPREQEPVLTR